MKIDFSKKVSLGLSLVLLIFFELFIFSVSGKSLFGLVLSKDLSWYFLLINIILQGSIVFYLIAIKSIDKKNYFRYILLMLLNLGLFGFLFFSPIFLVNQLAVLVSSVFFVLLFLNLTSDTKFVFTNIVSFFTIFLFFFNAYSFFYVLALPYWFVMLLVSLFSILILLYKFKHVTLSNNYLLLFVILFAIIISEFFLFSFFWPFQSIVIRSLALLLVYYLFWGFSDLYINNKFSLISVLKFMVFFIIILGLVIGSFFIKYHS